MKKIRVGIVNYLNTKPLIYGLRRPPVSEEIELTGDYPARLADALVNDQIDVGLIPVAAIHRLKEYHIVGNYCIGAEGEIASVCLFSEVPVESIQTVYLDYQSRTSVALLKVLMKEYWKISPELVQAAGEDYLTKIAGTTAGLVIGDRALRQRTHTRYIYDLGTAWKAHTGLPFVFAAWVSNKKLPEDFIKRFDEANAAGLQIIDALVAEEQFPEYNLQTYYTQNLSYFLDDRKREGLELFLGKIKS